MSDEEALLKAIIATPDEDTPRLAFADWLDENRPDRSPSPADGPSARAEYIRVQCRLAAGAFDSRDYPELLEKERDLAEWLSTHDAEPNPQLDNLFVPPGFSSGEWNAFRRGFLETVEFDAYADDAPSTARRIVATLDEALRNSTARTLQLVDATAEEIELLMEEPVVGRLRGFRLDGLDDRRGDAAVVAIANSSRSRGLRRLYLDLSVELAGCRALARSRYLRNLDSLVIDFPIPARAVKQLVAAKWFRNLRRLHLYSGAGGDIFRVLADVPPMP
ncbi:MAG TPA: TIGR02996 domain-containing protein, partial [Gemmata sp.]|nr:TIGR02996 domain-containing protein [Gemmata sp.]